MVSGIERSILVYDVGGSHVSSAVCTPNGFQLGRVVAAPHPADESCNGFLDLIERLGCEVIPSHDLSLLDHAPFTGAHRA